MIDVILSITIKLIVVRIYFIKIINDMLVKYYDIIILHGIFINFNTLVVCYI